jgi:hypothetical protein
MSDHLVGIGPLFHRMMLSPFVGADFLSCNKVWKDLELSIAAISLLKMELRNTPGSGYDSISTWLSVFSIGLSVPAG